MGKITDMDINELKRKLAWAVERGCRIARNEIVHKHLSGPKMPRGVGDDWEATLQPQSGDLRGAIKTKTSESATGIVGEIYVANVEYALIHETGGTKLMPGRGMVKIPRRPYMKPSLIVKADEVVKLIDRSIREAFK